MYRKSNYAHRTSRAPYARARRPNRRGASKTTIDPSRFIKAATPSSIADYKPQHQFGDLDIHPLLKSNLAAKGYLKPSEIQDKTITLGLEGRSVVGVANTGTGKTAAFALPILNKLMRHPTSQALVIAPTRELAMQIEEQCRFLAKNGNIGSALLIGGLGMGAQLNALKHGSSLIIGTPGRIMDHMRKGSLNLSRCDMVVLDEVDRMLDMGFINDVRTILARLPQEHQAFFFSATLSPQIQELIRTFAVNPELVNVKSGETSENVHQNVVRFNGAHEKISSLNDVLLKPEANKTLIFGKTKWGVERLATELKARGFKADALHGGKSQGQRKRALDGFKDGYVKVLVATDVAARGIDVKDISHVINYDQPQTYDDYVHRIGRAGRQGTPGHALTFVETH